ncbi:PASTA domain-containing protein [Deinococcus yavapaiensis]|uniref:PASTA domain-containing protein n=1 Tax=Deinococcus yavapaiensis TaxID=309889 RepID=UPI001FE27B5F
MKSDQGEALRLGWFDVSTPAARASFHRYRAALRDLSPAGLADVVARPGAYYSLWKPVEGALLADFLASGTKDEEAVDALGELAQKLARHGYALSDAEIVMQGNTPIVARLAPLERSTEEVASLNAPLLAQLSNGKVRRRREKRPRRRLTIWGVLPGLLFLAGAGYLGVQAAQIYLNPPVSSVPSVAGQDAQSAASTLVKAGYRVTFARGEEADARLGSVIGQDPEAGSSLHTGRLVTLTVNDPPPLTVPRVEDLSLDQARSALAEAQLRLGDVTTVDGGATNTEKGRIVAQLPPAGTTIARGQRVRVLVSSGIQARQTWLPDLGGMTFEQARDFVRNAGLVVTRVVQQTSDKPESTVLAQDPKPYAKVDAGTPVVLTIAKAAVAAPATPVPELPLPPQPRPVTPSDAAPSEQPSTPADETSTPDTATTPDEASTPSTTPTETSTPDTATTSAETSTPDATPPAEATTPDTTAPSDTAPSTNDTPDAAVDSAPTRAVQLDYTFPTTLPEGTVQIVVTDADGERALDFSQPSSAVAGARAEGEVTVRGDATFSVRVDGTEVGTFTR